MGHDRWEYGLTELREYADISHWSWSSGMSIALLIFGRDIDTAVAFDVYWNISKRNDAKRRGDGR